MSDTLEKSVPLALSTDPWHQLEENVPYCLVGQPTWIDRIGGVLLLAVRKKGTTEVHVFKVEPECIPAKLQVHSAFVVRKGKVSASL